MSPDTIQEILRASHIGIGVLTGAACALLAMLFWNSSLTNRDLFTTKFLQMLSAMTGAKVVEIIGALYRASRINADAVPVDATVAAVVGRAVELILCVVMIWFLLRPETKKKLNGATKTEVLK